MKSRTFRLRGHILLQILALSTCVFLVTSCDLNGLLKQGSTKKSAILFGITLYNPSKLPGDSAFGNLTWPTNDVASMQSLLSQQGWDVVSETDSTATNAQLIADITTLAQTVEAGQRVLFYYSGHGIDPTGALVPVDAYLPPSSADETKCIDPKKLASYFQPIIDKGANLILILDSCFSGHFVATGTYTTNLPDDYNTGLFTADNPAYHPALFQSITDYFKAYSQTGSQDVPNVWVLSAAGIESSYDALDVPHGAFTAAFLDGMNSTNGKLNADYDGDGYITLSELNRHSTEWLNNNWNNQNITDNLGNDVKFFPHLSGNPLDILMFKK